MPENYNFLIDPSVEVEIPKSVSQRVEMVAETLGYYTQQVDDLVKSAVEAKKREITLAIATIEARLMVELFQNKITPEEYATTISSLAHKAGEVRAATDAFHAEITNQFRAFVSGAMNKGSLNYINQV
jgi:hypothetical protein